MVQPYNLTHPGKDSKQIKALLDISFESYLQFYADVDYTDYSYLKDTDFETPEKRAKYFYWNYPPKGYFVDFPNERYVIIKMLIDPCRGKVNDLCCDGSNESECADNTNIISGTDIGVAWFINGFVFQCGGVYEK